MNKVIAPSLSNELMLHKNDTQDYLKNTNSIHIIFMIFGFSLSHFMEIFPSDSRKFISILTCHILIKKQVMKIQASGSIYFLVYLIILFILY